MSDVDDKIGLGRAIIRSRAPYMMSMLLTFVPIEVEGTATMGVTDSLIWFYDPNWILTITDEELAGALNHEINHVLREHLPRSLSYPDKDLWNKAADCTINPDLLDNGWKLPHFVIPKMYGLPDNLTAEEYYDLLQEKKDKAQKQLQKMLQKAVGGGDSPAPGTEGKQKGKGGKGGKGGGDSPGQPGSGDGEADPDAPGQPCAGSCGGAAGNPKLEELENKLNAQGIGRSDAEKKAAAIQTAADIKEHIQAHGRGSVPGHLAELADKILEPPVIPWKNKLKYIIRKTVGQIQAGGKDYSLRRPSKRSFTRGMLRPGLIEQKPVVVMILDTSGSMGLHTQIKSSLREAVGVMRALGIDTVYFLEADIEVAGKTKRMRLQDIVGGLEIHGRGGTSFIPAIAEIQKLKPRPNLAIYYTDGDGQAPDVAPTNMAFIWCILESYSNKPPAKWGHFIFVKDVASKAAVEDDGELPARHHSCPRLERFRSLGRASYRVSYDADG